MPGPIEEEETDEFDLSDVFGDPSEIVTAEIVPRQHVVVEDAPVIEVKVREIKPETKRPTSGFKSILRSKRKMKYLLDGMLPHTGLMFIGGISGTGKTILAIQTVVNMVMGRHTITSWRLADDVPKIKALFLSLEMNEFELQQRFQDMGFDQWSDEDLDYLEDNMEIYHEAKPFRMWEPDSVSELYELVRVHKPHIVLIDSASVSLAESLKDDVQVNRSLENLRIIRNMGECAMLVVAHTRKTPSGNTYNAEDVSINDLFGHSGVAQHASCIWLLHEDPAQRAATVKNGTGTSTDKLVHAVNVKARFGPANDAFKMYLTSSERNKQGVPLEFRRDAIAIGLTPEQKEAHRLAAPKPNENPLAGIDFGIDIKKLQANDKDD